MYRKERLVMLVSDALECYRASAQKINEKRREQIRNIERICAQSEFDVMIIHTIEKMIVQMNLQSRSIWHFYQNSSRLAEMLGTVLEQYKQAKKHEERIQDQARDQVMKVGQLVMNHMSRTQREPGPEEPRSQSHEPQTDIIPFTSSDFHILPALEELHAEHQRLMSGGTLAIEWKRPA